MDILLTDEEILKVAKRAWPQDKYHFPLEGKMISYEVMHANNKAQLKKVVEYIETLKFYDDWGGTSGKFVAKMIKKALLEEIAGVK